MRHSLILFAAIWLAVSTIFSFRWIQEVSCFLPAIYVWWVVIGIALLPGFLMSGMFFSNLLHRKHKKYPCTCENVTVIMCAHNEEATVSKAIHCICNQNYQGHITLLVVDNHSSDCTKKEIIQSCGKQDLTQLFTFIFSSALRQIQRHRH